MSGHKKSLPGSIPTGVCLGVCCELLSNLLNYLNGSAVSATGVAACGVNNLLNSNGVNCEGVNCLSVLGVATTRSERDSYNGCDSENQLFHFTLLLSVLNNRSLLNCAAKVGTFLHTLFSRTQLFFVFNVFSSSQV